MTKPINLRQARKKKQRADKAKQAEANRIAHDVQFRGTAALPRLSFKGAECMGKVPVATDKAEWDVLMLDVGIVSRTVARAQPAAVTHRCVGEWRYRWTSCGSPTRCRG